ncbi:cell division protein FtsZ [bacterium]|jgi:cell division protein FtsZ|nr:cell division protein FtsZ [bacterium]
MQINQNVEELSQLDINIKIVGVGGGGGNAVHHLIEEHKEELYNFDVKNLETIVMNTDSQALAKSNADKTVRLGTKMTKGLGAGMKPEVGREAAKENYEEILEALSGADIVFIASGLGGGTGTGAISVVSQAAKETGALVISIVTKPFQMEGSKRLRLALSGLEELSKITDSLIVINNEKLNDVNRTQGRNLGLKEAFKEVDEILSQAVKGIVGLIASSGEKDINVDFADLSTVLSHTGNSLMSLSVMSGEDAASKAIQDALDNPLLEINEIKECKAVLVHFTLHPDYPLGELTDGMAKIHEISHEEADIIYGSTADEQMETDTVKVTLIATGFSNESEDSRIENISIPTENRHTKIEDLRYQSNPNQNGISVQHSPDKRNVPRIKFYN